MNRVVVCRALVLAVAGLAATSTGALAAPRPSISIVAPKNGIVIHGSSLTVHFSVRNFRLLSGTDTPKGKKGTVGHIQARLDSHPINPATDIAASTIHTWKHVPAGHHVLTVWLANPMNVPIPGVSPARLSFTVRPPAPTPTATPVPTRTATSPGIGQGPRTGGGDGVAPAELNHNLLLVSLLALVLGAMMFLMRRLTFGLIGGRESAPGRALIPVSPSPGPVTVVPPVPANEAASADAADTSPPEENVSVNRPEPRYDIVPQPADANAADAAPPTAPEPEVAPQPARLPSLPPVLSGEPAPRPAPPPIDDRSVAEAVDAARRMPRLMEDMARRIEQDAHLRRQMQERIAALEQALQQASAWRTAVTAGINALSDEDVKALRYVAGELTRDPDHIVTLAAVSQQAERINRVIAEYARLHATLHQDQQ